MRIVALCDALYKGLEFRHKIGCDIDILVCNHIKTNIWRFWASNLKALILEANNSDICAFLKGKIRISAKPLGENTKWLKQKKYDIGLHAAGVIYRKPTIDCFKQGILNAHIGKLPEMRGRSVMEWSLLQGVPTGITCFFIDEGIDTGRHIILFEPCDILGCASLVDAKNKLFSQDFDIYRKALEKIKNGKNKSVNNINDGKRYYVMSPLLYNVIENAFFRFRD